MKVGVPPVQCLYKWSYETSSCFIYVNGGRGVIIVDHCGHYQFMCVHVT